MECATLEFYLIWDNQMNCKSVSLPMFVHALVLSGLGGCGLVDSNVADFDLTLPQKKFTVDASTWNVNETAAAAYLSTRCDSMPQICGQAAVNACKTASCSGRCDGASMTCVLGLGISTYQAIDLLAEKPELKTINDQPLIKVTIDKITYQVVTNTLSVDTPEMTVFLAPNTVMSALDPQAKPIGRIPPVKASSTLMAAPLEFTDTGKADLIAAMNNFKVPFNVIVGASITINSQTQIPVGKLEAAIQITAHAGL
jgi:hypothetical protein